MQSLLETNLPHRQCHALVPASGRKRGKAAGSSPVGANTTSNPD